jgi:hypothetical protein
MSDQGVDEAPTPRNHPASVVPPGNPVRGEEGGPPDTAPETGGPAFSKGGHRAGEETGPVAYGSHDLHGHETARRASAEPPKR